MSLIEHPWKLIGSRMGTFGLGDVPSKCKGMLATRNGENSKKQPTHVGE
jgi:hypothetical protein